jgi:hypothetical protein
MTSILEEGAVKPIAYMKDVGGWDADHTAYDECFILAAKGDPGAFPVYASPSTDIPAPLPGSGETVPAGKWHDIEYLMAIIDAAIEGGFDPDEDGPVLDEIRAEVDAGLHRLPNHEARGDGVRVDDLAQIIRRVDGENKLGAGALAEAIVAALSLEQGETKR